ncbi:MAG: hypothetical protein FK734_20065 [Asgard group archaeon]|nr:hypothetical protein [Asgard group archaeon]
MFHYRDKNTGQIRSFACEQNDKDLEIADINDEQNFEFQQTKITLINNRRNYLKSTDYYVLKEIDIPGSYPEEIKNKRILAWQEIEEIENATNIDNYNLNFGE